MDMETLNTNISSEVSKKIVINSPIVKNIIGKQLEIVEIPSYIVLDSVFEYEVLDNLESEDSQSSEKKRFSNGKGILKQATAKSHGSGGSSASSSKKVSFCRTTTFFEKKSRKGIMLESQTLS
ncbi:unnamed protein product (macronuclear) [Paramecium tetraurelia]|uniref:Uncharacterized protein n=1 Tax=Paramecium tetraurelia TaxID=5888 RepID=A0BLJ9_PARTE|nr:uncharacterized protein GSPATT00030049001 [Paramecium tetraurelia]CAK59416.1 unnamed protein product [Paramecium tetraurelia]|eukprot:XP_001426814.1 hypothetical protein (macronuclear) [Paramecium tetraurelia strain d4-2]